LLSSWVFAVCPFGSFGGALDFEGDWEVYDCVAVGRDSVAFVIFWTLSL
jgi:hypothetical protein